MIHKIKAFGLASIAVAAMGAAVASAAQAGSFDIGSQPAVITGTNLASQQHDLTIPIKGGFFKTKCSVASFEGTVQGKADVTEATVTATYSGCKVNGLAAVVRMNGCKYTVTGEAGPFQQANVDIAGCTTSKKIEIEQTATGCIVTIGEQLNFALWNFSNSFEPGKDLEASFLVPVISFTQDAKCPEPGLMANSGTITGNTTVNAFNDSGTTQVTKHGHQYTEHKCGTQVSLTVT